MGFAQEDNDDIISGINITPLVDIMLVLLIIFMLVSSIVDFNAIKVELPQAATGENVHTKTVSIMISQDGDFYLAGDKAESFDVLESELALKKEKTPDLQVAISADRKTYHQEVIRVIDMVRKLEINRFAINVEYLEESGTP